MTPRALEADCQATIVAAACLTGWQVHAQRPAPNQRGRWLTHIQGHPGFPDLILVKGGRVMAIELKRKPNKVEDAQVLWLRKLRWAGLDARVVWVPEEMDAFIAELACPFPEGTAQ